MNSTTDLSPASSRFYSRAWRWHFYAALIVIPFVLWQSLTGVAYLWHRELAQLAWPQLVNVVPSGPRISYDAQLESVLMRQGGRTPDALSISDDPRASTVVYFNDANGLQYPAFVNPYTGEYLGTVSSTHWIAGLSRGLHGGWPIKPWGSYLLELGACWAIVMILTGVYLWWPRHARGLAGVLYPRLRAGSRVFWRDLHATVGIYAALVALAFLCTALPWTTLWGARVLGSIQQAAGQESPVGFFFAGGADHHHAGDGDAVHRDSREPVPKLTIDELVTRARAEGLNGSIEIRLAPQVPIANLRDQHARAPDDRWLQLDTSSGSVTRKVTWQDLPAIPRAVALGINLHEGTFFGRANQVFNTAVAGTLVWLCVTGLIGWYRRRPNGGLAPPPRREVRFPKPVLVMAAALCVLLPLLGLSVLLIFGIDRMIASTRLG